MSLDFCIFIPRSNRIKLYNSPVEIIQRTYDDIIRGDFLKKIEILPELGVHKFKIDFVTGNFSLKIIDYAQCEMLKNFLIEREYNSKVGEWKFNFVGKPKIFTLSTDNKIFLIYEGENLIEIKDELGRNTKYFYDENFLTRVIYPDGSILTYFYDENKKIQKVIGRDGKTIFQNEYDELGRITKLNSRSFEYDDQNLQVVEDEKIFYKRNHKKLLTKIIFADGTEENFDYDSERNLIFFRNRQGKEKFYTYENGLLTQKIYFGGFTRNFEYDNFGNLIKIFDSKDRETILKYSTKNLLIEKKVRLNVKDWRHEIFERDIIGRILTKNINGQITNYAYDENFPLPTLEKTPCGYKFSYRYDKVFRLLAMKTEIGEKFFSYTPMNEIIGDTKIFEKIERPERNFFQSEIEIFDYGGRLIESRKKFGEKFHLTRFKYDLNSNCVERRDWLDLQDFESATGRVDIKKFEYDAQNRLIKKIEKNSVEKFKYDCLNRRL